MAAKDYTICEGMMGLYFAKTSKKDPHRMLNDRRLLTESEILGIIHWYAKTEGCHKIIDVDGKPVVELKLIEK
jgi:hypothetical protein